MKVIAGIALFVLCGIAANGQEAKISHEAKIIAEIAASKDQVVKNSPFSAEAISESVQTLADGNRIVRSSTSKLYRNSEGRFRREIPGGSGGMLGSVYSTGQGITILDPVAGHRFLVDSALKTARVAPLKVGPRILTGQDKLLDAEKELITKRRAIELAGGAPVAVAGDDGRRAIEMNVVQSGGVLVYSSSAQASKYETRIEELGIQNIEGVDAKGTRTITTIPAGAIGNERPIEVVYEKWYSDELQLTVMSKHNDPRFGEQTYRLTNIVRSEPDPSLFTLPHGYKITTEPGSVYRVDSAKAGTGQNVVYTSSPKATTTVKSTKPQN